MRQRNAAAATRRELLALEKRGANGRADLGIPTVFNGLAETPAEMLVNRKLGGLSIDLVGRRWRDGIQVFRCIFGIHGSLICLRGASNRGKRKSCALAGVLRLGGGTWLLNSGKALADGSVAGAGDDPTDPVEYLEIKGFLVLIVLG